MESSKKVRCKFRVVKFFNVPFKDMDEYVCVPCTWLTTYQGQMCMTAYPHENPSKTRNRVKNLEEYQDNWLFYLVEEQYETDYFEDAESWIAAKKTQRRALSDRKLNRAITREDSSESYKNPINLQVKSSNSVVYFGTPTPGSSKDNKSLWNYYTRGPRQTNTTASVNTDYDSDESSRLVICEEATPSPTQQQSNESTENRHNSNIGSKATHALLNQQNDLSLNSIQISDVRSIRNTNNEEVTHSDTVSHNRASIFRNEPFTYNPPCISNNRPSTSQNSQIQNAHLLIEMNRVPTLVPLNLIYNQIGPEKISKESIAYKTPLTTSSTETPSIIPQNLHQETPTRNISQTASVPSIGRDLINTKQTQPGTSAPIGTTRQMIPLSSEPLSTTNQLLQSAYHKWVQNLQQLQTIVKSELINPNSTATSQNNKATTSRDIHSSAIPSCSSNQSSGLQIPSYQNRIPNQYSTATSSTTNRTAAQNPKLVDAEEMLDIFGELFEKMGNNLFHTKEMYQNLRSSMIQSVEIYHDLLQSGELYNESLNTEDSTSSTRNVALKFPKISDTILTEIEPREDSEDNDGQFRNSHNRLRLYFPPEYNPNDTRWTLKYRKRMPGLVELVPKTDIYIIHEELQYAKHVSKDCQSLAQQLLPEVFNRLALGVCLTITEAVQANKGPTLIPVNVEPVLDQTGRTTLLKFVMRYGAERGWTCNIHHIISAIDIKIKNYRFKYRVLPKLRHTP